MINIPLGYRFWFQKHIFLQDHILKHLQAGNLSQIQDIFFR